MDNMAIEDNLKLIITILNNHDRRFDEMDDKINDIKQDLKELKQEVREDRRKLDEVYESRNRVAVKFTASWISASFFIAMLSAVTVVAITQAI